MVAPKGDYPVPSVASSGCVVPNTRIISPIDGDRPSKFTMVANARAPCSVLSSTEDLGALLSDLEAGKAISGVGARVDVDAVGPEIRISDWRMSVHDDPSVISGEFQKFATYA
jgi:hypothetical protein